MPAVWARRPEVPKANAPYVGATPVTPVDILSLVGALAASGVAAGLIAGLLGVGGGIVVVPVLYSMLPLADVPDEVRMHLAVGTSLATIIATGANSARAHARRGAVDWPLFRSMLPGIVAGVAAGVVVGTFLSGDALSGIFALMAVLVGVHMATSSARRVERPLPGRPVRDGIAALIGGFSVVMGIGGGSFCVPTFTLFGVPVHRAVGTASAIGLVIAIPGAIGFAISGWGAPGLPPASVGYVNLLGFILVAPASTVAAPIGARVAHALPQRWLSRAFAVFLFATGVRMALPLVG